MAINFVLKAFTLLTEAFLSVLLLAPLVLVAIVFASPDPVLGFNGLVWSALIFGYYVSIITIFGVLALLLENNQSLKRIVDLLEAEGDDLTG